MPQADCLLDSDKFRVERRAIRDGYNRPATVDVVVHPGAAVILPLLDDGRVILIRNYRYALEQHLLELPAGTLAPGEDPIRCAARELREETGYTASLLRPLTSFYSTPGICDELMHVFVARNLRPGSQQLDDTEQISVEHWTLDGALTAIREGGITDGKTMIALLHYARFGAD